MNRALVFASAFVALASAANAELTGVRLVSSGLDANKIIDDDRFSGGRDGNVHHFNLQFIFDGVGTGTDSGKTGNSITTLFAPDKDAPVSNAIFGRQGSGSLRIAGELAGGTYWNHKFGNERGPSDAQLARDPGLAVDTAGNHAFEGGGMPESNFSGTELVGGVFDSDPDTKIVGDSSGKPFNALSLAVQGGGDGSFAGLKATVERQADTTHGQHYIVYNNVFVGDMLLTTNDALPENGNIHWIQFVLIPSPGVASVFGLAGIAGIRRRRA